MASRLGTRLPTDGPGWRDRRRTAPRAWPSAYASPQDRRRIGGWLAVGLALRLLLMPFAVSTDTLAVYWRSHLIAYDGTVFSGYLVNMGAHYVHALSLRITGFLLPPEQTLWTDPWWWSDSSALAPQVLRGFVAQPDVHTTLVALKLPYLAFDLAAGGVLLALAAGAAPHLARRAWVFWMLSPIGLYAGYVFARYEAFPVAFVLAALLAAERRRPWLAALLLGLGITMRTYPLLLVPIFALIVVRRPLQQLAWAALAVTPFALVMASNQVLFDAAGELARLRDFSTGATFFAYALPVDGDGQVLLFPLAALLLAGALLGRQHRWWAGGEVGVDRLWVWLLVFHAAMFGLATFSAHYLMWLTPFVALALLRRPDWRGTLWLHLAQVVLALALADLLGIQLASLFAPLSEALTRVGSLRELFLTDADALEQVAGVLRTAFVGVTVLLAWPAVRELWGRPRSVGSGSP